MYDWNDLKFFLAVARDGSTLAASRRLGVSQATVSRRIALFEECLGIELFVRQPSGYALTARGEAMLAPAEAVEAAAERFAAGVGAETRRLSGQVRLTTVDSAASAWAVPAVAALHATHPDIQVEIVGSDANLDLIGGEADVAIRFGERPDQETLIVRRLVAIEQCFYAQHEMVARLGRPGRYAELERFPIIANSALRYGPIASWYEHNVPGANVVSRVNSLHAMVAGVRAGIGGALLPTMIGDAVRGIVRLFPPIAELSSACWLVTTDQARRQPHVRAVIDAVADFVITATAPRRQDRSA